MSTTKSPLKSKTLWVNLLGMIAMAAQSRYGFVFAAQDQAVVLGAINLVLRLVTKGPVDWSAPLTNKKGGARSYLVASMLCLSLAMLALGPLLSGCSAVRQLANDDVAAQVVVRAAATRVLKQHPNWTADTYRITGELIDLVNTAPRIDLGELEQEVISRIDWDALPPGEQIMLQALLSAARQDLESALEKAGVKDTGQVQVQMVRILGWINYAAVIRSAARG